MGLSPVEPDTEFAQVLQVAHEFLAVHRSVRVALVDHGFKLLLEVPAQVGFERLCLLEHHLVVREDGQATIPSHPRSLT